MLLQYMAVSVPSLFSVGCKGQHFMLLQSNDKSLHQFVCSWTDACTPHVPMLSALQGLCACTWTCLPM